MLYITVLNGCQCEYLIQNQYYRLHPKWNLSDSTFCTAQTIGGNHLIDGVSAFRSTFFQLNDSILIAHQLKPLFVVVFLINVDDFLVEN